MCKPCKFMSGYLQFPNNLKDKIPHIGLYELTKLIASSSFYSAESVKSHASRACVLSKIACLTCFECLPRVWNTQCWRVYLFSMFPCLMYLRAHMSYHVLHACCTQICYVLTYVFGIVCPIFFTFEKLNSKSSYAEKFLSIQRNIWNPFEHLRRSFLKKLTAKVFLRLGFTSIFLLSWYQFKSLNFEETSEVNSNKIILQLFWSNINFS